MSGFYPTKYTIVADKLYNAKVESLSERVLAEELLNVLKIPADKQSWFKNLVFDVLNKEFKDAAKTESFKQLFVKRFYDFLVRDGRRQDRFIEAVQGKRMQLLRAIFRHFAKELEIMNDPVHDEVLEPIADAFNTRQKYPMPGRDT